MVKIITHFGKHKKIYVCSALILIVLAYFTFNWYINNIYPYKYVENCFEENTEHFKNISEYFKGLSYDNINSATMKNGKTRIYYKDVIKTVDCDSCNGYKSLLFLKEHIGENKNYVFDYVTAYYDFYNYNNVMIKIPVYTVTFNNHHIDIDDPIGITYFLVYCDNDYTSDNRIYIDFKNKINDTWFITSEKIYAG